MTSTGRPPASWYPDPSGRHEHRFWDGERWTAHVADNGVTGVDGGSQQPVVHQPVVQPRPVAQPVQQPWTPSGGWQTAAAAAATPAPARSSMAKGWLFGIAFIVAVIGIGATALVALGGSGNDDPFTASSGSRYPAFVETNFMNSCTATGGTTDYCRCGLEHLEQSVDLGDFAELEQDYRESGQLPESITDAIRACISKQVTPAPTP
jgi:hypothetical protein